MTKETLLVNFGQALTEMTAKGREVLSPEERSLMDRLVEAGLARFLRHNPGVWLDEQTPCGVYVIFDVGVLVEGGKGGQTEWLSYETETE